MSSPEAGDEYREINQHESQEFIDAIEGLKEFWEWGIGDNPALWEEIYGPESEWTEKTKTEFEGRSSMQSSYFKLDEAGIFIYKQTIGKELMADTSSLYETQWGAHTATSNTVGDITVSVSSQLQVGRDPEGLYVPSFIQWERFQLPDGTFTMKGRSPAEQVAIDKMDIARDPGAGGWGQPPSYWDAMGKFNKAVSEIARNREEMEEITGIDTRRFTKTKFDEIMHYLGRAGAENYIPDSFS